MPKTTNNPLILAVYIKNKNFNDPLKNYATEHPECLTANKLAAKEFFSASDAVAWKNKVFDALIHANPTLRIVIETK